MPVGSDYTDKRVPGCHGRFTCPSLESNLTFEAYLGELIFPGGIQKMRVLLKGFGVWGSLGFARWTFQCWLLLALDRMWTCLRACEPGGTHRGL